MSKRKPTHVSARRRPRLDGAPARAPRSDKGQAGGASGGASGGAIWLHGTHAVMAALANPARKLRRLLLSEEAERRGGPALEQALKQALERHPGLEVTRAAREEIERRLGAGAVHQGLALEVAPLSTGGLEPLLESLPAGRAVVVVLDQVTDPHNVGAILRSAAVFGAAAVVATERNSAPESGILAKSASGALEVVPYLQLPNLARALDALKANGFWVLGLASEEAATLQGANLPGADLPDRLALCLGAEGTGLRRLTRERCDFLLSLPAKGAFRDLNVSNAAAVALYELIGRHAATDP